MVTKLELRTEYSLDVKDYIHSRKVREEVVKLTPELLWLKNLFYQVWCT